MDVYIKRKDILSLAKKGYLVGNGNYQSVKNYINSIPAADVVERKIGKWEHDGSNWENRFICSACGHKIFEKPTNYCSNCGAVMVWY